MAKILTTLPEQLAQDMVDIQGAHGDLLLQSEGMFVMEGLEEMRFLAKGFPCPILSYDDPANTKMGGGFEKITPSVPKTSYEGSVTFIETEQGAIAKLAEYVANVNGGMINADVYIGRPDNYTEVHNLLNIAIRFDPADFDTDSRSEVTTFTAQLTYNYFGTTAKVGANYTASAGKVGGSGVAKLVNRVNSAMSKVRKVSSAVSGIANSVGAIASVF